MASFFYVVSYCHLPVTLQTMSIIVETYNKIELWFEFYRNFKVFSWLSLVYKDIFSENISERLCLCGMVICWSQARSGNSQIFLGRCSKSFHWCEYIYIYISKVTDWPRRAVAEFRLCVGHDCLGAHLHRIGIRPDPYCMLCSLHEPMDRNRLGQCTALTNKTECERYWEARTKMMENWLCYFIITKFCDYPLALGLYIYPEFSFFNVFLKCNTFFFF